MPDQAFDTDAVLKLLKKSKASGNELPFAFGLAGKPESCGLMVDLRKFESFLGIERLLYESDNLRSS